MGLSAGIGGLVASPRLSLLPESYDDPGGAALLTSRRYWDASNAAMRPLPEWWG